MNSREIPGIPGNCKKIPDFTGNLKPRELRNPSGEVSVITNMMVIGDAGQASTYNQGNK